MDLIKTNKLTSDSVKHFKQISIAATISLVMSGCGGGTADLTGTEFSSETDALASLSANPIDESTVDSSDINVETAELNQTSSFTSATTSGFNAQIMDDGSVELEWVPFANAVSYEVYRDDELIITTGESNIIIPGSIAGTQTFEIQAIDEQNRAELIADGLELEISEASIASASEPQTALASTDPDSITPELGAALSANNVEEASAVEESADSSGNNESLAPSVAAATPVIPLQPEAAPEPEAVSEPVSIPGPVVVSTDANANQTFFESHTDAGFNAQVQSDGSAVIRWNAEPNATGYNLFRDSEYYLTVFDTTFHDQDIKSTSHYYQVDSFDAANTFTTIAEGLTVDFVGGSAWDEARSPEFLSGNDYELVFSDEFEGSELDLSKWETSYLWGADLVINSEEQYYVDIANEPDFGFNPFSVDNGLLTISSIETPEHLLEKANQQRYLSGVITSWESFKFTYGYVETRARLPRGRGYWSAFWLLNAYYVGANPEIDIMEHIGHDWDWVYHTYHYFDEDGNLRSTKSQEKVGVDYTNDFHTFGVEWSPGKIDFYVDGVVSHTITDSEVSSQEMYIIANTAIGGWWPGSPDFTTTFPGTYEIDYIRAFQRTGPLPLAPQNDGGTRIPFADDVPNRSPNHIPSPSQWPQGYPWLTDQ